MSLPLLFRFRSDVVKEEAGEEERRPRSHHYPRVILLGLFTWCGTSRTGSVWELGLGSLLHATRGLLLPCLCW